MQKKSRHPPAEPSAEDRPSARQVVLPAWKKVLFAVVATILAFAAWEGLLAVFGVKPAWYSADPYVGFSSSMPLFVEETAADGTRMMVTAPNKLRLFNSQQFPRKKAPGTFRIFALGGSTTYGRPYDDATSFVGWLREYLRALAPDRKWEVINAGGISYASYREAKLMEALIAYQPDLFIVCSGQNEFLEERTYGKIRDLPESVRGAGALVSRTRTATVVRKIVESLKHSPSAGDRPATVLEGEVVTKLDDTLGPDAYTRDDGLREQVLRHFRFNLARMVEIARSVGAGVIFITPATNLRDCSPFKSEHRAGLSTDDLRRWQTCFNQARQALTQGSDATALAALDQAIQIDDRYALVHFARGQILVRLGRFAEAKQAFERARDEDVCPLRALGPMPGIMAKVAAEEQAPCVDFVAMQEARSEHGIPGAAVFLDHVHPTIESHRLLALELLKTMEREGLVKLSWDEAVIRQVTQKIESSVDPAKQGIALMNLSKVLGWAGKLQEARRLAVNSAQLNTNRADVQYQAGLCAQLLGQVDDAIQYYRRAVALDPTASDPHGNLGVALEDKGELQEACEQFAAAIRYGEPAQVARNQANLARVRQKLGLSAPGK